MARPPAMSLHVDPRGRLVLSLPTGEVFVDVTPVRCFPLTEPDRNISFVDDRGHEVFCLPALNQVSGETRRLLEDELSRRELIPVIRRVFSISAGAEPTTWHVETDRGETRFELPSEDNVRRFGAHGAVITDAHGLRFRIVDVEKLDAASRRELRRYL